MFPEDVISELEEIRSHYPHAKAAMMPVLHVAQQQKGWLDQETQAWVADFLSVDPIEVHEVVTFYPMLYATPNGEHVIHVCRTLSCDECGARELWAHLKSKLGVERGGTTSDGKFTLRAAECLASCGTAPAFLVDGERHESLSLDEVDALLESV